MGGRPICPGGICPGGKCLEGKCPGGICLWGKCPGGTCMSGFFCPVTLKFLPLSIFSGFSTCWFFCLPIFPCPFFWENVSLLMSLLIRPPPRPLYD